MCMCEDLAYGDHVLMDCCGRQISVAHHLHKGRQLLVANLVHGHVTKVRQDAVVHPLHEDGDIGSGKLSPFHPCLQSANDSWDQVGKFDLSIRACLNPVPIQLGCLDVEELLGQTDGRQLVRGLEALRVGPSFKKTPHLPVPAGIGLEDAELGGVVGNGRDGRRYGQGAVSWREVTGVVCCLLPSVNLHARKRNFGQTVRATEICS